MVDGCGLLGAVVGGDVLEERVRSATETAVRPVDGINYNCSEYKVFTLMSCEFFPGFVIEGFDLEHSNECFQSILWATTEALPESSPRFIHGVYSPGLGVCTCSCLVCQYFSCSQRIF